MERDSQEKLKKLAIIAAPLVGAAAVKYAWRRGLPPRGYIYHFPESGNFMIGVYNWAEDQISEIAGRIRGADVELEQSRLDDISDSDITGMEEVVNIIKKNGNGER
jgi:hypothetical protein